ncbi:MAG TPA: cytochrome c [Burkholderiales bacterium]|nr:cytochrome c [Burkholderiales bacterium]
MWSLTPPRRGFFFAVSWQLARTALVAVALYAAPALAQGDPQRGLYISKAAGCLGCHTEAKQDAVPYAGGRALNTAFGTFYGPNITPHPQNGIGGWTEAQFIRALRHGERPDGASYFPAFPYTSFTGMSDHDARDLWAYLRSLAPSPRTNRLHEIGFPYGWRPLVRVWKWLYFTPGPLHDDRQLSPPQNRGRYLVQALGHCGECHTPRNMLGAMREDRFLAGARDAKDKKIPNLTPARLKSWTDAELRQFMQTGDTPDGDSVSESMAEVVRNTTSQLTPQDLAAMIAYLRAVPPIAEEDKK